MRTAVIARIARFFDIVNGFLIDAVAHRVGVRGVSLRTEGTFAALTDVNLAEIIVCIQTTAASAISVSDQKILIPDP